MILGACALALLAAGCSRGDALGSDEAIEILVLDGVAREKADCIITSLDGAIGLEKITGIDSEITDEELALLAQTNAGCASDTGSPAGVVAGTGLPADLEGFDPGSDVDEKIDELVVGGLDPVLAECLRAAVWASEDPHESVEDLDFLSEAAAICQRTASASP